MKAMSRRAEKLLVRSKRISADAQVRHLTPEEADAMQSLGYGGSDEDD